MTECYEKLLDLDIGLRVHPVTEDVAEFMASTTEKAGERLSLIQEVYPNACIVSIRDEWGMGFYGVSL